MNKRKIEVVAYRSDWQEQFEHEKELIFDALGRTAIDISHIGGTLYSFTSEGWVDKPSEDATGCIALWNSVLDSPPKIETFSQTAVISDWSALYFSWNGNINECFFYNHHGKVWVNATTDRFSYYAEAVGNNPPGTIIGWQLD